MTKKKEKWLEEAKPNLNYKVLLKFFRQLRKDMKKKDKEAIRVDLNQIIGRAKNLLIELDFEEGSL